MSRAQKPVRMAREVSREVHMVLHCGEQDFQVNWSVSVRVGMCEGVGVKD